MLNEAYTDYLGGHDLLCTRYKITPAAAKAVQKCTATKHINTALQKALLVAIEKEVKLKHLSDIPKVVENEQKFGVLSMTESDFVMKLSSIALFLQMSTIIRSEVKAVAGAARKLFMTPDIFRSLASHITAIQPGFDLLRSYHFASVDDLIAWLAVMSRINYLQEAATSTQLPAQLSAVYLDVFDKLSADMFNNPAPFTLERLTPIVELLREMLATRSLDADNVIMDPPQMPPPSTPTPNFKKHNEPLAIRRLEAEAEVFRAEHTLRSLGGGRGHDGDRSFSTDGRIQHGGERKGRGVGRGAGRGNRGNRDRVHFEPDETKTCLKCNGQGHLANVCPSESAGEAQSARNRATPVQTNARLRALSQELTEADKRLFGDEWDDDARGMRTDGRQFQ